MLCFFAWKNYEIHVELCLKRCLQDFRPPPSSYDVVWVQVRPPDP